MRSLHDALEDYLTTKPYLFTPFSEGPPASQKRLEHSKMPESSKDWMKRLEE
jgi:hypothetical protein